MMGHKYIIVYSARTVDDEGVHGEIHIETEKPLETQEELQEVARSIGQQHSGYVEVALNKITEVVDGE